MIFRLLSELIMSILNELNNREKAILIWFILFFIWVLFKKESRRAFRKFLKAFLEKKIVFSLLAMLFYIFLVIKLLKKVGIWDVSALKDTVFWILGSAFTMYLNISDVSRDNGYFKKMIVENFKFSLILEFIVNLYSFSLVAELIVMPMIVLTILLNAFVESKQEYWRIKKPLTFILGLFGLILLSFSVGEIISDFNNFATFKNLRDFSLPVLLSTTLLPFIYIMALAMQYETLFVRIDIANKNVNITKYVKKKVLVSCHINLLKLNKVSKKAGYPKLINRNDYLKWIN